MANDTRDPCRHCGKATSRYNRRRGLCNRCYQIPSIRTQYTPDKPRPHEPTEAELDVMIAEQMANLPPWWHDECAD